jgi:antitoxin (DNA-binding transcriptional repressor) of toxin-antitoxin stability system
VQFSAIGIGGFQISRYFRITGDLQHSILESRGGRGVVRMERMTKTVEVSIAEQSLTELIDFASEGNEVILSKDSQPVAKIVPIAVRKDKRTPGLSRGIVEFIAPDFDAPMPDEFWLGRSVNTLFPC